MTLIIMIKKDYDLKIIRERHWKEAMYREKS